MIYENQKKYLFLFLHSAQHYYLPHAAEKKLQTQQKHRQHRRKPEQKPVQNPVQNPVQKLQELPARSWMIYISRKTRFLQTMRRYGTKYLA